jgi:hypothetical protein
MRIAQMAPLIESMPPKLYGGTKRQRYGQCNHLWQCGIVGHVTLPPRTVRTEANPWRSHRGGSDRLLRSTSARHALQRERAVGSCHRNALGC